jgi:DNA-binding transcriptional LysR family regulator
MIRYTDHWLGIEVRHLAALQAVAREGTFHGAAERLGYTQSAVSQQVAGLERIVGERLIDRPGGPRKVALTEAGQLLLRHAETILARLQAAQADLAAFSAGATGTLRVGTYQSVGRCILPRLMREFTTAWPRLEIRLHESASDAELLPLVERGELDLAFGILPLSPGPFEAMELMLDPYVLVVPAASPLAGRRRLDRLEEIMDQPLIGFRQCRSVVQVEAHLQRQGIEPHVIFRSDDNGTVQALVAAGIGLALVPRLATQPADPQVAFIELGEEMPGRRLALVWHRDRYQSPAARAFAALAASICRELDQPLAAQTA